jgi:hypothetical protein
MMFDEEEKGHNHNEDCGCLPVYKRDSMSQSILTIEDFQVIKVIGKGTFGKVILKILTKALGLPCDV